MVQEPGKHKGARTLPAHPGAHRNVKALPQRLVSLPEYMYEWLRKTFNLTAAQASGFLGNFQTESGFSPTAYNAGENAHGFAQWENGRWTSLQSYAAAHHLNPTSTQAELGYMRRELTGSYAGVLADVKRTTTAAAAAQVVQSEYEGSTIDSLPQRESNAAAIFARVSAGLEPIAGRARNVKIGGGHVKFVDGSGGAGGGAGFSSPILPNPIDPGTIGKEIIGGGYGGVVLQGILSHIGLGSDTIPGVGSVSGAASDAIGGAVSKVIKAIAAPFERWITDAFVIVLGAVLVVMALWLVARSASHTETNDDDDDGHDHVSRGRESSGGVEAEAEEAAGA